MIFPRLSPDGIRVAGGNSIIEIDGILIPPIPPDTEPHGTSPVWYSPNAILYTYSRPGNIHDGMLVRYDIGTSAPYYTGFYSGNILTAGGRQFAIWRPDIGVKRSNDLSNHPDWTNPALSDDGVFAHSLLNDGVVHLSVDSSTIARQRSGRIEVFIDAYNPQGAWIDFTPEMNCHKPIPVWTGKEIFILFHTNDGCIFLGELWSKLGYIIRPRGFDGGSGYTHDAKLYDANHIRVVSPVFDSLINLNEVRVSLPSVVPPIDPPEPEPPDPPDGGDGEPMKPVVPPQDVVATSCNNIRAFCQSYEFNNQKPYVHDEIHENGLFLSDGIIYFMMSDTGRWAQILMDPTNTGSWDAKRTSAESALFKYMKERVGDFT